MKGTSNMAWVLSDGGGGGGGTGGGRGRGRGRSNDFSGGAVIMSMMPTQSAYFVVLRAGRIEDVVAFSCALTGLDSLDEFGM